MTDLTPETLAEWLADLDHGGLRLWEMRDRFKAVLDALVDMTRQRDEAVEAIKAVHPQSAVLYMMMSEKIRDAEAERDERCGCAPEKLVQKWDGGNLAMLCPTCYRIVGYAP